MLPVTAHRLTACTKEKEERPADKKEDATVAPSFISHAVMLFIYCELPLDYFLFLFCSFSIENHLMCKST
jgi:hypothetical protein